MADAPESPHYFQPSYDKKSRFASYWHQIDEVRRLAPAAVLEVGIGSGFVSRYLRDHGFNVTTVDIDPEVKPDQVASVLRLPFADRAFAAVMCCEVLEHLPFADFGPVLAELHRVCGGQVVISLPDRTKALPFMAYVPWIGPVRWLLPWPTIPRTAHPGRFSDHAWEIGAWGCSLGRIKRIMAGRDLVLRRTFRVFERPRHRFFVLDSRHG